jgi:NTP pyrophosphatase (non-canonical NTP hydrolase)
MFNTLKTLSREADAIGVKRTPSSILGHTMAELGELALEINIENGYSYKQPDEDGVVGEAIDTIMCLLDLIHVSNPNITENDIAEIMQVKGRKWIEKEAIKIAEQERNHRIANEVFCRPYTGHGGPG